MMLIVCIVATLYVYIAHLTHLRLWKRYPDAYAKLLWDFGTIVLSNTSTLADKSARVKALEAEKAQ